jgi:ribose 5-phosphate isomerase B
MKLVIGSDHAAFDMKQALAALLARDHDVEDTGCHAPESCDYPDYAERVALAVRDGRATYGILLCGTGIGMSIAANKIPGIRAGVVYGEETARLIAEHNDANIICLPARGVNGTPVSAGQLHRWVSVFLSAARPGSGRHRGRVDKIGLLERRYCTGGV